MLVRAAEEGDEGNVNEKAVFASDFKRDLADSLKERLGFDITYRAADFGDDNVGVGLFRNGIDESLDFVRDVGNDLNG